MLKRHPLVEIQIVPTRMVNALCEKSLLTKGFVFSFTCAIPTQFTFEKQLSYGNNRHGRPGKRRRALSDVDGGLNEMGKKKRRLRLNLITSRLSRPFSSPATNIVDRGISKIAVWAKKKALGENLLRKAAIMNAVRRRMREANETERRKSEELCQNSVVLRQLLAAPPRNNLKPPPPSPLGLSNYDALDLEDEYPDEEGLGTTTHIYSDFNIMNPASGDGDDYEYLDEMDGIPHDLPEERAPAPPPPLDERLAEMLREKDRQREISFLHLG